MWDAIYDCLFFCINQEIYDSLTAEQQAVVDECGQKAVEYERYINRSGDEEIMSRWQKKWRNLHCKKRIWTLIPSRKQLMV